MNNMKSWRKDDEGRLGHDGDCRAWGLGLCTCGLIHHLMPDPDACAKSYAGDYWADRAKHDCILDALIMMPKMKLREATPKEQAEMRRVFKEMGFEFEDDFPEEDNES